MALPASVWIVPIEFVCVGPFGALVRGGLAWACKDWRQRPESRPLIFVATALMALIFVILLADAYRRIVSI
jgi:hypothetical protein